VLTTSNSIKQMLLIFSQKENNLGIWKHVYILVFGYFYLKKKKKIIQKCMFQTRYKKTKQDK
jgi:hypothetical protein